MYQTHYETRFADCQTNVHGFFNQALQPLALIMHVVHFDLTL